MFIVESSFSCEIFEVVNVFERLDEGDEKDGSENGSFV